MSVLTVSRALFDKDYSVNPPPTRIKKRALLPSPKTGNTSVNRIDGLSEDEIWGLSRKVAKMRGKALRGRGDIPALAIANQGLVLEHAPMDDNEHHYNIANWPTEKHQQMGVAQALIEKASFIPFTPS